MSGIHWPRVVTGGALWMVVYNFVWGVAWFAFMRTEWMEAMTAIGRPMPFTAEVWFLWVTLTLPIGVAVMARAASDPLNAPRTAVYSSAALWLLMTLGMAAWALQQSLSLRLIVMDSTVNLAGLASASLIAGWGTREV